MGLNPRPCSAAQAVERVLELLDSGDNASTGYALGTGNYHPTQISGVVVDRPWTETRHDNGIHLGCDCAGLICWAFRVPRHRPGYNLGGAYDVEDDLNSNSFLGDASGAQDLFTLAVDRPLAGDVIAYPTIRLPEHPAPFIGHVALVLADLGDSDLWDMLKPTYSKLDIAQVCGPTGRKPACIRTVGHIFDDHDITWPKAEHRSWLIRARP